MIQIQEPLSSLLTHRLLLVLILLLFLFLFILVLFFLVILIKPVNQIFIGVLISFSVWFGLGLFVGLGLFFARPRREELLVLDLVEDPVDRHACVPRDHQAYDDLDDQGVNEMVHTQVGVWA